MSSPLQSEPSNPSIAGNPALAASMSSPQKPSHHSTAHHLHRVESMLTTALVEGPSTRQSSTAAAFGLGARSSSTGSELGGAPTPQISPGVRARRMSQLSEPIPEINLGANGAAAVLESASTAGTPSRGARPADLLSDDGMAAAPSSGFEARVAPSARRRHFGYDSNQPDMLTFMRRIPHLYVLSQPQLEALTTSMLRREYALGDEILRCGAPVQHAYIVLSGRVEVYTQVSVDDDAGGAHKHDHAAAARIERVGTVNSENMFCIDSIIFDENSTFLYKAGAEGGQRKTLLGLIPKDDFMRALDHNVAMRQSIGRRLADHMDVFICFKDFCRNIFSRESAKHEYLPLWQILDSYYNLNNSIHNKMRSSEIDTGAWGYAIHRLPENVTTTFIFDLARALPPFLAQRMRDLAREGDKDIFKSDGDVRFIATKARRRCTWQLGMEGKSLVLLRDGFTDLIDFLSCLCIHIIESNKLRGRLQGMVSPPAIDILDETLKRTRALAGGGANDSIITNLKDGGAKKALTVPKDVVRDVLRKLNLTEEEQSGLLRIWPTTCIENLWCIIMHREEYLLRVDASASRLFQIDPFHDWSLNLRHTVMTLMGLSPRGQLPADLIIDIISSNTHSTQNILSPFARLHRAAILDYAKAKLPEVHRMAWETEEDLVYFAMNGFIRENGLQSAYLDCLKDFGIKVTEDTGMTGLKVDIVPVSKIDMAKIDPLLASRGCAAAGPRHFILNTDFAFGAQADGITKTLVETFGKHIRSFSVMGKAGGIAETMERGDIQLASHVLLSKSSVTTEDFLDELRPCGNADLSPEFLNSLAPSVRVWNGPVLTIPGTMLQNATLLKYYRSIWHCTGLEMEGSYFLRQIRESQKHGMLSREVITRFAYYTSDLPLRSGEASLATGMRPNEGVPPLYAIARAFLIRILGGSDGTSSSSSSSSTTEPASDSDSPTATVTTATGPSQSTNGAAAAAAVARSLNGKEKIHFRGVSLDVPQQGDAQLSSRHLVETAMRDAHFARNVSEEHY